MEQIYEYIYAVRHAGSFKAAAELLHVTQPALSIALKKYEEQIHTTVFNRKQHPFGLTPAGEILVRNIETLALAERRMNAELADLLQAETGDVRIAATHYVMTVVLPPILNRFVELYPKVNLHLYERSAGEVAKGLLDGTYDISVCAARRVSDNAVKNVIRRDGLLWVIPNKFLTGAYAELISPYPAQSAEEAPFLSSLEVLSGLPYIALLPGDSLYEQSSEIFCREKVAPLIRVNVPQSATAWHLACAGIGAALIPEQLVQVIPPQNADISIFRFDSPLMQREISAFYRSDLYLSNTARKFLTLCGARV